MSRSEASSRKNSSSMPKRGRWRPGRGSSAQLPGIVSGRRRSAVEVRFSAVRFPGAPPILPVKPFSLVSLAPYVWSPRPPPQTHDKERDMSLSSPLPASSASPSPRVRDLYHALLDEPREHLEAAGEFLDQQLSLAATHDDDLPEDPPIGRPGSTPGPGAPPRRMPNTSGHVGAAKGDATSRFPPRRCTSFAAWPRPSWSTAPGSMGCCRIMARTPAAAAGDLPRRTRRRRPGTQPRPALPAPAGQHRQRGSRRPQRPPLPAGHPATRPRPPRRGLPARSDRLQPRLRATAAAPVDHHSGSCASWASTPTTSSCT